MQFPILTLLIFSVMFVNGWTDAPNSISTLVITGTMPFRRAAAFAAVCEFFGVIVMSLLCPTVAETMFSIANFGSDSFPALIALQSAFFTIVLWSVLAWIFGLPTSESHALVAALTGASIAIYKSPCGISAAAWFRVLIGLLLSTLLGSILGYLAAQFISFRFLGRKGVQIGQCLTCGIMAFFHGAQDGQKFLALLLLSNALASGQSTRIFQVSLLPAVLCAVIMACGVLFGGQRIIRTLSHGMNSTDPRQGLAADLAAGLCLLSASIAGIPMSTTHTKISALLGAGASAHSGKYSALIAFRILTVWLLTFPCCGVIAWGITLLMLP